MPTETDKNEQHVIETENNETNITFGEMTVAKNQIYHNHVVLRKNK